MIKGQTTNSFSLLSDDETYRQPTKPVDEAKTAPPTTTAKRTDANVRSTGKPSTSTPKNNVGKKNDARKPRGIYFLFYLVTMTFRILFEVDEMILVGSVHP